MKKFSLLFILIVSIFCSCQVVLADDNEYKDGYDAGYDDGFSDGKNSVKSQTPIVKIIQVTDIPKVDAGDVVEFDINFQNVSKANALNLHITPQIEGNDVLVYDRPLEFMTTVTLRAKKEGHTVFKIKTSEDAKIGTYPLKLKLEYKNSAGEVFTRDDFTYFEVVSQKTKPILNVSNIKMPESQLKAGDTFNISFDIVNIGGSEATETDIKLEGFSNSGIMPIGSNDYAYIGTINKQEFITQSFGFKISDDIETKDNTITATITYKDYDNKEYTTTKNIFVTDVKLKEKDEKKEEKDEDTKYAKPKMIISSYRVNSNNIIAGDDFVFSYVFKNTSKEKDIRNIKVTVSSKDGAFIITKGSNTFYFESMKKSQSISNQIELKAKQDLASNSYAVFIDFDYEDYDGNEYSSQETINIPVVEYSKLVINSASVIEGYVGMPCSLSFDYANMGKAVASNLTVSVIGDYEAVQEKTYIGNIQAGSSDYYDIEVKPTKEGTNFGTLILTFEDSSGREIEVSRTFDGTAFSEEQINPEIMPDEPSIDPSMPGEEVSNFTAWQIILAGLGSFVVLFIVTRIITKKIVLKKFEDEI